MKKNLDLMNKIQNRESIFKTIVLSILAVIVGYKIIITDVSFNTIDLGFTDILSLLLAVFAIGLSVAFYFKATDTSNKFYDNTFKFTKDISEILGRIEAGFGERLKHLDEGYTGLRNKFEGKKIYTDKDIDSTKKEMEEDKIKLEEQVKEKDKILDELMIKAQLNETDRSRFLENLRLKESEIHKLNKEISFLKRNIRQSERARENEILNSFPPRLRHLVINFIKNSDYDVQMLIDAPVAFLQRKLRVDDKKYSSVLFNNFLSHGVIREDGRFTSEGIEFLKSVAKLIEMGA